MASGVPVIASHSSSLPEVVGDAGILVDPYQPDELLQALTQILTDQGLAESLRTKSLERAKSFTWEKTIRATHDIFLALGLDKKA